MFAFALYQSVITLKNTTVQAKFKFELYTHQNDVVRLVRLVKLFS